MIITQPPENRIKLFYYHTCLLFVYCELTSDLFFLKKSLPVESIHAFGNEYDVKPITLGSIILCWFNEITTSSISLKIKWSCGLM